MELVKCTPQYWEFVRALRNDERVLDGFIKSVHITEEMQIKYMKNHSDFYRIAKVDGNPAGYVGVIEDDIRVCTHPDFFGMGVGKFMIKSAMAIWPTAYAKVKHGNVASDKLFISCGFEEGGKDDKFTYYKKKEKDRIQGRGTQLKSNKNKIYNSKAPYIGSKNAEIQIVEFFDYNSASFPINIFH